MNHRGLEQMVHFPTREKNTLDLILTTLPGQFKDVHSPDKLSDHDIVSGTLKSFTPPPPIKKPRRKVYLYQKGDYESMRKDTLKFAKEKYFNDTRSVQENFNLLTSFIQDSVDNHILSKTSRSVSSVPWITPEIRMKIRRKNKTHAKAKKIGSSKLRSKFETLRREIKADVRKQHDLYVNNLVGDVLKVANELLEINAVTIGCCFKSANNKRNACTYLKQTVTCMSRLVYSFH